MKQVLHSSSELTSLIQSVKSRYKLTDIATYTKISCCFFKQIVRYCDWHIFLQHYVGFLSTGPRWLDKWLYWIFAGFEWKTLQNRSYQQFLWSERDEQIQWCLWLAFDGCYSSIHLLLPLKMYLICGSYLYMHRNTNRLWTAFGTIAVVSKFKIFLMERNLYLSMRESAVLEEMKEKKRKINEFEDVVTLALLIESSTESSFQFFFQMLYRYKKLGFGNLELTKLHYWRMPILYTISQRKNLCN